MRAAQQLFSLNPLFHPADVAKMDKMWSVRDALLLMLMERLLLFLSAACVSGSGPCTKRLRERSASRATDRRALPTLHAPWTGRRADNASGKQSAAWRPAQRRRPLGIAASLERR